MNRPSPSHVTQILYFLAGLVSVHIVNFVSRMWLTQFGIVPRSIVGLRGIIFSPLLHKDWSHVMANTVPLGVMLTLLSFSRGGSPWLITSALWIGSGLGVWLVGRPGSIQIGASGLIYSIAAFLLTTAWLQHNLKSGLAALVVVLVYGGMAWGLFPGRQGVSWEGHLAGAIAGLLIGMAYCAPLNASRALSPASGQR